MVPSLDTYLYTQVAKRLQVMLRECYIMNETLKDIDKTAREAFIRTFCGEHPKQEVEVSYMFPQQGENFQGARYVISLGGSEEINKSIGGIQGTYDYREDDAENETVYVKEDGENSNRLFFDTSKYVGDFIGSEDISFAADDYMEIENGKIMFDRKNNEHLIGKPFNIYYSSKVPDEDVKGMLKGYTSNDTVGIVPLSSNIDTVRCLDAILRVILITLRDNTEEKMDLALQTVTFADMQPIIQDGDIIVFGRPCTMRYKVTNSVNFDVADEINSLILRRRSPNEHE